MLLPELETPLLAGDRILFCGTQTAKAAHPLLVLNQKVLRYVQEGVEIPDSIVWRWLAERQR
jgi:voltage-gated potassium channel